MKHFLIYAFLVCNLPMFAQTAISHSIYDVNEDGKVNINDVTNLVDNIIGAYPSDKIVYTSDYVNEQLKKLKDRIDSIEQRLGIIYPYKVSCSFPQNEKNLYLGEYYTQNVVTNSDGAIRYESTDNSVVSIDEKTGSVTTNSCGIATIICYISPSNKFSEGASCSYNIIVKSENFKGSIEGRDYIGIEYSPNVIKKWSTTPFVSSNSIQVFANSFDSKGRPKIDVDSNDFGNGWRLPNVDEFTSLSKCNGYYEESTKNYVVINNVGNKLCIPLGDYWASDSMVESWMHATFIGYLCVTKEGLNVKNFCTSRWGGDDYYEEFVDKKKILLVHE